MNQGDIMNNLKELWPKGLAGKLIKFAVIFVAILGLVFMTMSRVQVAILKNVVQTEGENQTDLVQSEYMNSMSSLTEDSLLQLIAWAADKTDDEFWILDHDMRIMRDQVEDVFRHPENYARKEVLPPRKENAGVYTLQLLCPNGVENIDPKSMEMLERLANLAPTMKEIVKGNVGYTFDCYVALPDGSTIAMDDLSDRKFDENGKVNDYDPRVRPWYVGAVKKGDVFFSNAVASAFYDFKVIVFGVPVYVDGELVAVIEGATELEILQKKITERNIGKEGFSILISDSGQLICSPRKEGELKVSDDPDADIRTSVNPELMELVECALSGKTGTDIVTVDGEKYYAAHAPLITIGWTQIAFVSEDEMMEPTNKLVQQMESLKDAMLDRIGNEFSRHLLLLVLILLVFMQISIIMVSFLAKKSVEPINHMTKAVTDFVGEDMAFEMEDLYKTGDEIEELAVSFETMSRRMKEYVNEIVENAAEKEKLQTEMKAATQIQEKMLPRIYPDFYDKPGYEIYAKMVPAKNVGGDLYDFFYLDEDHLAFMIGDVSGKGITAALFMVLCKQMIKSQVLFYGGDLVAAIKEANVRLCEESADSMFVTVWIGIITLSTGELNFINAGHVYAAVKKANGDFEIVEDNHSLLMGALDFAEFNLNTVTLGKGDVIYLYTDGVTEAHNINCELFGDKRLADALNEGKELPPDELDDLVRRKLAEYSKGQEQYDDITTVVFKYNGID